MANLFYKELAVRIRNGALNNNMSVDEAAELIEEQIERDTELLQDKIDTLEQMLEDERDMAMGEDS